VEESKSDATQKAQFLAASAPHSGDWLLAIPVGLEPRGPSHLPLRSDCWRSRSKQPRLQTGSKQDSLASAPERPDDPCLGISGRPWHKGTSRSYTQRRIDSDLMAFREALSLGCDSRQHHSRVLRRCRSSRTRRGGRNGCHQDMSEVLWAIHGILVLSNRRRDSGPNEWLGIWVLRNSRLQNNWRVRQ